MTSAILLAGGVGNRFGSSTPKQFLPLGEKAVALHSFERLQTSQEIQEVIVVCEEKYRPIFPVGTQFAAPGIRRQDSLFNGLLIAENEWILIHDGARPFIDGPMIKNVIAAAKENGAAAVGIPATATLKQCGPNGLVMKTLDRREIWEMHTPQVVKRSLLEKGFRIAQEQNITVTDDLSLAELAGGNAKIVMGSFSNIKITTPMDILSAEGLLAYE